MKYSKLPKRVKHVIGIGVAVAAISTLYCVLTYHGMAIPCLFYRFTGFLCPGCGNSRAALALLRLDLTAAFGYNLLFPVEFFYLAWVIFHACRSYLKTGRFSYQPPKIWLDISVLASILIWWVLRNIL